VSTLVSAEDKRILDEMLLRRMKSSGETAPEAIGKILQNLPEGARMIVDQGITVDARTVRIWALFYCTPEGKQ
jgi:hypothetical protein